MTLAYDTSDGTIMEALNNKADIDLNNLSADDKMALIEENKETVMGWMMPDYSKGVNVLDDISQDSQYIPPKKGFLFLYVWNDGAWGFTNIKDGSVVVSFDEFNTRGHSVLVPIDENGLYCTTKIKGNGDILATFFPLKGIN